MAALYLWFRHLTTGYDDGKGVMRIKNMQIYRKNCWWRKERVSQKARQLRSRFFVMRRCLAAILVWEAVIAIGGIFPIKDMDFCIVEKEEDFFVEWIVPDQISPGAPDDVYGMHICLEAWKIEFYHRTENLYRQNQKHDQQQNGKECEKP